MATSKDDPLHGLTDAEVERLQGTFTALIEHINPRIFYAEGRRGSFATFAITLLAAGVALIAALLANEKDISSRSAFWALTTLAIGSMLTGIVVLAVYAGQTNYSYPFKKATSTWKWFYRDAISGSPTMKVPWSTLESERSKDRTREVFESDWKDFVKRQLTLKDVRVSAAQDLQQLYVLHVNEFYKNRFLTQIRSIMAVGLLATGAATAVVFFATWVS